MAAEAEGEAAAALRTCSKNCVAGGAGARAGRAARPVEGNDFHSEISIPFQTAVVGGTTEMAFDRDGKHETISVKIPPGIANGGKIRLRGQGEPGVNGGPAGDIILTVHVAPHPHFTRAATGST